MLSAASPLLSLPCPSSPATVDPSTLSLPSTPEDRSIARTSSTTSSDDSSFDLSFEYLVDEAGNYVRISNRKSSPPTPPDKHYKLEHRTSPRGASDRASSSPDVLSSHPERRSSLSRSESASAAIGGPSQPAASSDAMTGARSFQRVASGPVVISAITPVSSAPSLRSDLGALSAGISNTARRLGRPQRVTKEQRDKQEEWNRLIDQELQKTKLEEKENLLGAQIAMPPPSTVKTGKRPSLPPLSRHSSAPQQVASSPSPSQAEWTASMGSSADDVASGLGLSRSRSAGVGEANRNSYLRKTGSVRGAARSFQGSCEDISENDGSEIHSADEYMAGTETDTGEDPPPPYQVLNGLSRGRSHGDIDETNGAASSPGTRARRSFSVSGAPEQDSRQIAAMKSSRQYPARQEMGLASSSSKGARRVTAEERYRMARLAEEEAEAIRQRMEADARKSESEEGYGRSRQSPSPTHKSEHMRPVHGHQRKDSDTLRSVPHPTAVTAASSPTAVDAPSPRLSPSGANMKHRRSPTAPEPSTSSAMLASSGQSSKTPGRTWASGESSKARRSSGNDSPGDAENGHVEHHQPGEKRSTTAPPRSAPLPAVESRARSIVVNKKAYARLDCIGKGGSSRVYRVMSGNNEIHALKRVTLDQTDAETMNGYMNEISLLKRLAGNDRIIRLVDSEVKDGVNGSKGFLHLVMECGEIDLARLLQEQQTRPMNMVWIAYYWQQMLEAVHVIHEEKIVHSDLKPANFVLVKGQLKLIDFGIANAIANDTTNIQRDHQIGTVNYMSPEAIEVPDGKRRLKVGRPSDVWSLGCILYQMVYGYPPFQQLSVYQKMKAIPDADHVIEYPSYSTPMLSPSKSQRDGAATPPQKLDHLRRPVPKSVIATIKRCLCRNPKERATIPELLQDAWLTGAEPGPALKPDEGIIDPHFMYQLLHWSVNMQRERLTEDRMRALALDLIQQLQDARKDRADARHPLS